MAIKRNATVHVSVERIDRMNYIIDHLGDFGDEILLEAIVRNPQGINRLYQITNKGVMIIRPLDDTSLVVTAWIATIDQAMKMARMLNRHRIPDSLYKRIIANKNLCMGQP